MPDLERFDTLKPQFAMYKHDLSPITTREEFNLEQVKNSLTLAGYWLDQARKWAQGIEVADQFFVDLSDAEHHVELTVSSITSHS